MAVILQQKLNEFLAKREPPKTFCPSEVARALSTDEIEQMSFHGWREAMPAIRELVWHARAQGQCEVLQKGSVLAMEVGLEDVTGPIRVRRRV